MRLFLAFIMAFHGAIHFMGFTKAFSLAKIDQLSLEISKPVGILWLLAGILFIVASLLYLLKVEQWWMIALPAVILSQVLIILSWGDAKFGTLANLIILLPLVVTVLSALPSSYRKIYKAEVRKALADHADTTLITEDDLKHLPEPVKGYLRYVGVVGQPKVHNFRAISAGAMRMKKDGKWMKIRSEQHNFFDDPARLFYIESSMFGLPFDGLHKYVGPSATMQIKVAGLLQVVDAQGEIMNKSETVTLFNDMCLLAPAALIDHHIQWATIDPHTVKAIFTNGGNTISATLILNDRIELVNFLSNDRSQTTDGKTYKSYPWSTPVRDYHDYNGYKIASYGEAVWHTPDGEFPYARFNLKEIEYNRKEFM